MIVRNINDIVAISTSHGCGQKKVLLANDESRAPVTQIAITRLAKGTSVEKHTHPTMEEYFFLLYGLLKVTICGSETILTEGGFIQIEAGCEHSLEASTDCRLMTIGCAVDI